MFKRATFAAACSLFLSAAMAGTLPADRSAGGNAMTFGKAQTASVIFDQGPATGSNGGCWSNSTGSQNFSDFAAPVAPGTTITGIVVFTCIAPTSGTVTFKSVDQGSHSILHTESGSPSSWVSDGGSGYIVTYTLASPYVVPASNVGYGLSGDGFELGQYSVLTPGDGVMSQFSGGAYQFEAGVGDQMYQLLGDSGNGCDLTGDGKYTGADAIAFFKACKASGAPDCGKQLIAFIKKCKGS